MFILETDDKIIELTKERLAVRLRPEIVEALKSRISDDRVLLQAFLTLLKWAQHPAIPLSSVADLYVEAIPVSPGETEMARLVLKCADHGGYRLFELDLKPEEVQELLAEVKKALAPKF